MKRTVLFILILMISITAFNQISGFDPSAALPTDPDVTIGKLDNGLTYYIRKNELPKDRAEFYLIVNAGAILENPDQNGLAHFCEHMAFNGTKNFEKKEIINYLQSIGMKFGPEINAYTSQDQTVYMLQKVPVDIREHMDTALMILYDWASNLSFENEEIDAERGVIHEEWRTGRSAMERMSQKYNKVIFKDSKYAIHDVIGDINILDHFEYETIKNFYRDWYRPDLQAIIAVGDFDKELVKKKITELFSSIPKPQNPRARAEFEVPGHKETLVSVVTDKEAQFSTVQLYYKHDPYKEKNMGYYRDIMRNGLYDQMLNQRLQELLQSETPPFIYAYSGYTRLAKTKDAYMAYAAAKNNETLTTLKTLLIENERILKYGFTAGELERSKTDMLKNYENQYNERNKRKSDRFVWEYMSNFLEKEPIPGIENEFALAQQLIPTITLEEVNALAKKWITEENRVAVITAPEKEGVTVPTEAEVLAAINSVKNEKIEPYIDQVSNKPLIDKIPTPGKITKTDVNSRLGTLTISLSNGATVVLKPTDFKDDEILFTAYSKGGASQYSPEDIISVNMTSQVMANSGLAGFDEIELEKMLSGKIANVNPWITDLQEGFRGNSSVADIETMFQLLFLSFTQPRADQKAFGSIMNRMKGTLENAAMNPATALRDTLTVTLANYSPYRKPMTLELLATADLTKMESVYKERFADPADFTFFFVGKFDMDKMQSFIETYIGGLPANTKKEHWKDMNIRAPKGVVKKKVIRDMKDPKATVSIALTGTFDYNYTDRLALDAINDILSTRLVETIREEEGGTYGAGVYTNISHYPEGSYQLNVRFDCDPENAEKLAGIVYREIEKLRTAGPSELQVQNVKENKLKTRSEQLKENNFWLTWLSSRDFDQENPEIVFDYEKNINSLNPQLIREKAAKYYNGQNIVEVILLPSDLSNSVKNPVMLKEKEGQK